jgi:hypothetical protein
MKEGITITIFTWVLSELPLAADHQATLLGVAAVVSAIGGAASTIWAIRKGRREERDTVNEQCRERLAIARKEAEECAEELHKLRMQHES